MGHRLAQDVEPSGFSLLELTMVLAILAVMLALAAPRYQTALANYRADAAAHRVITDLHAARAAAEQTSRTHSVTFDLDAHTISYSSPTIDQQQQAARLTDLAAQPYEATIRRADFDGLPTVSFDGFGKPTSHGTVVVRALGRERTVTLDASSGRARLE